MSFDPEKYRRDAARFEAVSIGVMLFIGFVCIPALFWALGAIK